jgi:hypothetical protein
VTSSRTPSASNEELPDFRAEPDNEDWTDLTTKTGGDEDGSDSRIEAAEENLAGPDD